MKTSGLDVHKDSIFCGIYDGKKHSDIKEFSTLTASIKELGFHLKAEGVKKVAMESTGIYWIPVWNILEDMEFELILVNPYLIKQMPGRKSDVKDAQWIATLLHKGLLRKSLVPDKQIRELRSYSRKYIKIQRRKTSVLQEMERTLEMSNIRITSFVSNIESQSVLKVIKQLIQGETDPKYLATLIHGRISNKHGEKIIQSLDGFLCNHHKFSLELSLDEYELLIEQSNRCEEKMRSICESHYKQELELLQSIPGIKLLAAMIIIAETGADMKTFENSGKFTGWTGLRPRNDESAGKFKSTAITKGNTYLRAILVQVAWGAVRTKGSFFKEKFNRLAIKKSKKKALIAIARKMAVLIWNILNSKQHYNPRLIPIYDPVKLKAKIDYHQKEFDRLEKLFNN